ncbi:hypothetical protein PAHAL_4G220400 [Panicum hallii]|jgi:hypothetical protein|uniref:Rx N-terminal domain-containing protein n=1 Tax=Panicum hallii TaxID=206008 RepID=A0A2T8JDN9_9POAL|nr:hypothetical protein PAHAL_4G220400 [Panicum hallii]
MQALLHKVLAMEDEGPLDVQTKAWAREVSEMAYDVDCIDAFEHRRCLALAGATSGHGGGIRDFSRCTRFLRTLRSWHQFASQIDTLKARAIEADDRRERYRLDDFACSSTSYSSGVDPWLCALFTDEP